MSILFLIPGLISLIFVLRRQVDRAFLWVYLPSLLLLPEGYAMRLPHLPPLSCAQAALIPLMVVAFVRFVRQGIPSLLDLLVAAFVISIAASEALREVQPKDGILIAVTMFVSIFGAYLVGKTLIEPAHIRLITVRRIVWLMVILAPLGLLEWRLGQNFYGVLSLRLLGVATVGTGIQYRGGHGRTGVSFTDAEIAGIAFAMTMMLAAWLFYLRRWKSLPAPRTLWERAERWRIPEMVLVIMLFTTQSRGPWMAAIIGCVIAQIPRFRKMRSSAVVAGILVALMVSGMMAYYRSYTNVEDPAHINDERVTSALYRRRMNEIYQPSVKAGGLLGWGILNRPVLNGMGSIDNEYLLAHLAFGDLGYWLLILIAIESIRRVFFVAWKGGGSPVSSREDQSFAFLLGASLIIVWLAVTTVYLGEQLPQFTFLLAGWGQALGKYPMNETGAVEAEPRKRHSFARVFQ